MKTQTKKILAALSALTFVCGASTVQSVYKAVSRSVVTANAETVEGDFSFDKSMGTITKYNLKDTTVEIPSEIDGVSVTSIGYCSPN